MARIRSIKPEFWTSGQLLECSKNARLLFIGLWNFCDDKGRHPWKPRQIKAEIFPSDDDTEQGILGMLLELSKNNLITRYVVDDEEYLFVTGWHHQRIDKPQPPKYPDPIQDYSGNILGTFPPDRIGKDRKGSDKKGKELMGKDGKGEDRLPKAPPSVTAETWEAYSQAYLIRYKTLPVRNASVNSKLKQVVDRLGKDEAPKVAAFYVRHNGQYYVTKGHPVGLLLSDAEKLRTEWATGRQITGIQSRQNETRQHHQNVYLQICEDEGWTP